MPRTCPATKMVRQSRRWCDLLAGHDGDHISMDAEGRAELSWRAVQDPAVVSIPWQTRGGDVA